MSVLYKFKKGKLVAVSIKKGKLVKEQEVKQKRISALTGLLFLT